MDAEGINVWDHLTATDMLISASDVTGLDDGINADNADWSSGSQATSSVTGIKITAKNLTADADGFALDSYGTGLATAI